MNLLLTHTEKGERGTNGELSHDGKLICYTIERPWLGNQRRISRIPSGTYELKRRYSEKFKAHLILLNVPNRDLILIHPANDAIRDLNGCIAPVTALTGVGRGVNSRNACEKVFNLVFPVLDAGEVVTLTIK